MMNRTNLVWSFLALFSLGCEIQSTTTAPTVEDVAAVSEPTAPSTRTEMTASSPAQVAAHRRLATGHEVTPPAPTAGVEVLIRDYWTDDAIPGAESSSFSISNTDGLVGYLYFRGDPGVHVAWVELRDPNGALYSRDPLAFAIGDTDQQFVKVDGVDAPVQIAKTKLTSAGWRTEKIIDVSGTNIEQYNMVGSWQMIITDDADGMAPRVISFSFTN